MRATLMGALSAALFLAASPALADQVTARDGRFEAQVSSTEMSRIAIQGEKVASIRKINDEAGPQMMVEAEAGTGDVFVAFDGEVVGRSFSAFLVTESGKTIQAILRPANVEAQTVIVRLTGADAAPPRPAVQEPAAPPAGAPASRREGYSETLVALIRLMFNGEAPQGVIRTRLIEQPRRAGPFEMRPLETFAASGLKGTVFLVQNVSREDASLDAGAFMIDGVLASAVSHETLPAGQSGRLYIVEADQ